MRLDDCFRQGLLKRVAPDIGNARRSLELSKSNIDDAAENIAIRRYRVVLVSGYTAMFHAARAILFRDGVKERSHECVPAYLKERYPELEGFANTLDTYRRFRHNAIYGLDFTITDADARAAVESAGEFLKKIKGMIG